LHAIITIQKYCRGWLVRRLFQWRIKTHKKFLRYEYQVRKIAFLFAQNTEADFSSDSSPEGSAVQPEIAKAEEPKKERISSNKPEETKAKQNRMIQSPDKPQPVGKAKADRIQSPDKPLEVPLSSPIKPPSFSIVPNPPKWAVRMMK